ncbi:MAG: hypothetical protein A3K10_04820 [Bacteroidetes bacterium RIFCSPLOWO2_12_FULL_31_6]|nr:MAG: hypothetical protein A3K10_04820 [Bacteroidetes bacterium RIFCSPLOWO2_12_FULL_31_6]
MLLIISPSKKMDFVPEDIKFHATECKYKSEVSSLAEIMKGKSIDDLIQMMSLSKSLATLNFQRYQSFDSGPTKQALFAFKGDVYSKISVSKYTSEDIEFAQKHLRILSGLYGLLRPLDLIHAYRLEMGVKLNIDHSNDLYEFWHDKLTQEIRNLMKKDDDILVNLASTEYSSAINIQNLSGTIVNVVFKNLNKGSYKVIGLLAKRARGMMVDFVIRNKISSLQDLKDFSEGGYKFVSSESSDKEFCFFAQ